MKAIIRTPIDEYTQPMCKELDGFIVSDPESCYIPPHFPPCQDDDGNRIVCRCYLEPIKQKPFMKTRARISLWFWSLLTVVYSLLVIMLKSVTEKANNNRQEAYEWWRYGCGK